MDRVEKEGIHGGARCAFGAQTQRRGFLTVAVLLLALGLLFLTSSLSTYSSGLPGSSAELARLEITGARYDAAGYGLAQIMRSEAVNSTYTAFNLSLAIPLPYAANYAQDVARWQAFAQAYAQPASIRINTSEVGNPNLHVRPQNISADYQAGQVKITPQNASYSQGQVSGYDVQLKLNQPVGHLNWTQKHNVSASDPSALYLHVGVQGSNGTVSDTQYLNRSAASEVRLLDTANQSMMTVQVNPAAALAVYYDISLNGSLTTVLGLNSSSTLELGSNVINASDMAQKTGPVQIQ